MAGYTAADCTVSQWPNDEFGWFFFKQRREFMFLQEGHSLCERCETLKITQLLQNELPWKTASQLNEYARNSTDNFRSLERAGSVQFWADCSLCRCLFAMCPSPSSPDLELLAIPDCTMNRLTGETDSVTDTQEWSQFSNCLLLVLNSQLSSIEFSVKAHRGDALCLLENAVEDEHGKDKLVLGGRHIIKNSFGIEIINDWISCCSENHLSICRPEWTQELPDIKFVDAKSRTIVKQPEGNFDYLALSYVWGGVKQPGYQLGSQLPSNLPQTIEDAMMLVETLGKQYLWVDSLCIDQNSQEDKARQIAKMSNIHYNRSVVAEPFWFEMVAFFEARLVSW
jgi:hypothetical protein